jgi:hypothetical protein
MVLLEHNPIARVQRRRVGPYAGSRALDADVLRAQLAQIDRSTGAGALLVALLSLQADELARVCPYIEQVTEQHLDGLPARRPRSSSSS